MKKPKRAASDPPPSPAPWTPTHVALLFAALLVATLAVYQPAWHGGFLWDDDAHVTEAALRSWDGLRRIWFDLGALFWPANVMFVYPKWDIRQDAWWQYLYPLAALLLYVVTLAPALGFVNVYPFRFSFVADHFQYLASVAVIAFVAAGTAIAARRYAEPGALVNAAVVLVVAAPLAGLSWRESHQYAAAETLYRTTIGRNPGAWMAHHNLAVIKARGSAADMDMAVAHATEAIRLNPTEADAHNTLGIALQRQGRLEEAAALYDAAIRLRPGRASAHNNLGTVRQAEGRLEEAIVEYRAAIVADPSYAEARNNLGFALGSLGRLDEAIAAYREALRLGPRADLPRDNLGRALYSRANELHTQNRLEEAVAGYREAVTFVSAPRAAEAHNDLGVALANLARAGGKSDR